MAVATVNSAVSQGAKSILYRVIRFKSLVIEGDAHHPLRCLWNAAPQMEDELAQRMRELALRLDLDFQRVPHTFHAGGGFVATVDSTTGRPRSRSMNRPYTTAWNSNYGQGIHARMANLLGCNVSKITSLHFHLS